ncbi:hypothetical protein EDB81DRAFT_860934 [Dactylonectria macrodidyma]|uniref:Uncharacterized protein n=1 Tax=Dactylonectria macrodidyma TaxID=307937 RepID=A0A9P9DSS9_9HYPO|nr:hypothetical protein EDB81DRAFT_860934 [Dactylonectria macrodidyma]
MVKAGRSLDPVVPGSAASRLTTAQSASGSIRAVIITEDHPVFSRPVPDVPRLIEVPVVLYRVGTQSSNQADLDNQIATYLNIDADSGFALPEWQSHVGTIIVARKDRKSLLPQHLEGVWMYCDRILDLFGEGEGAPRMLYSRKAFEDLSMLASPLERTCRLKFDFLGPVTSELKLNRTPRRHLGDCLTPLAGPAQEEPVSE